MRRPVPLIRWLGVFVWIETSLAGAMGLVLAAAAQTPEGFTNYPPGWP